MPSWLSGLADEQDLVGMLAGLDLARAIGGSAAMAEWRGKEVFPGPAAVSSAALRRSPGRRRQPAG
jgi:hypothetical protein